MRTTHLFIGRGGGAVQGGWCCPCGGGLVGGGGAVHGEGGATQGGGAVWVGAVVLSITGSDIITHTHTHPPHGQTNRCKNITLPQTSFVGGNYRLIIEQNPPLYWNNLHKVF